jgi:Tol biopolymer transport system component
VVLSGCYGCGDGPVASRWDIYAGGGTYRGTQPSLSPDGRFVVYSTPVSGHGDIYRFDRSRRESVQLTNHPEFDGCPVCSPNGMHIVFEREKNGEAKLWIMDIDGANQRPLTDGLAREFGASFSKDGSRIAFCRTQAGASHVWVMDADGGRETQVTDGPLFDAMPKFSPSGEQIVFRRRDESLMPSFGATSLKFSEMFIVNANGTELRRLTHNSSTDEPIAFSPDGKRVFYYREDEYDKVPKFQGVSVMDADGSNKTDLGKGVRPVLSPDGQRFAFVTYDPGIGLMNGDGTERSVIYSSRSIVDDLVFTPNGKHVVFVEFPNVHGPGRINILDLGTPRVETIPDLPEVKTGKTENAAGQRRSE